MQVFICLIILAIAFGITLFLYMRNQSKRMHTKPDELLTQQGVLDLVTHRIADILKEDVVYDAKNDADYEAYYNHRKRLLRAAADCVYGIDEAKIIIKDVIRAILLEVFPTLEQLYQVYPLNNYGASLPWWRFEILLNHLSSTYQKDALAYLIHTYGWDEVRYNIEDGTVPVYGVSEDDLDRAYDREILTPITYAEALDVVATIVYSQYKGMGIIDTLRAQNIDGFNIGTSGSIMQLSKTDANAMAWRASRSVWVYFEGKYIHFQFLDFKEEAEVKRVVQLIARYNNPGPLTEKRGYLVNTMYDKSRVLALRPPASEYWACFVRKFSVNAKTLESLINPPLKNNTNGKVVLDVHGNPKPKYKNTDLPLNTIKLLMRGQVTTAFTGRQGSGKTTMMVAAISQVDARFNIRVLEMAPEMYLREIYHNRNILSVQETPYITAAELQDALKKSDAALSIVGEVATDVMAARMLQMGQVAAIFTIFSHHANRTKDLVNAITNSVVSAAGGTTPPSTVLPQVIDVIHMDVHLDYFANGDRYIERITEIIRLDSMPYPEQRKGESLEAYKVRLDKEYYTRQTDRQMFDTRDVVVFKGNEYAYDVARNSNGLPVFFSADLVRHIFSRIPQSDVAQWKAWCAQYWKEDILKKGKK